MKWVITVCENGHVVMHRKYTKAGHPNVPSLCPRCLGEITEVREVKGR